MTTNFNNLGRTILSLAAALLIGFSFIAAATGPALVTPAVNSVILV